MWNLIIVITYLHLPVSIHQVADFTTKDSCNTVATELQKAIRHDDRVKIIQGISYHCESLIQ